MYLLIRNLYITQSLFCKILFVSSFLKKKFKVRLLLHSVPNFTHFVFLQSAYIFVHFHKYFYIFELNISKLLLKSACRDLVVYKIMIMKMKKTIQNPTKFKIMFFNTCRLCFSYCKLQIWRKSSSAWERYWYVF